MTLSDWADWTTLATGGGALYTMGRAALTHLRQRTQSLIVPEWLVLLLLTGALISSGLILIRVVYH